MSAVSSAKPTARRSILREVAAAARRQQEHAGDQRDDAAPADQAQSLADEERGRRRRHQRRRAARDRIDLAEIAGAIALDQRREIEQVDDHRGDQPRPGGPGRHADERQEHQRHHAGAERDQRRGRERVEPDLDQRIPAGVAERGEQNGEENEVFHARSARLAPRPAPTAWARRAHIAPAAPRRRRAPWPRASPNADRRGSSAPSTPCRPGLWPRSPRHARA